MEPLKLNLMKSELEEIGLEDLGRLLESAHVPARGRIKWISEKTGYSRTQVGDILGGRRTFTNRFKKMAMDAILNELKEQFEQIKGQIQIEAPIIIDNNQNNRALILAAGDLEAFNRDKVSILGENNGIRYLYRDIALLVLTLPKGYYDGGVLESCQDTARGVLADISGAEKAEK